MTRCWSGGARYRLNTTRSKHRRSAWSCGTRPRANGSRWPAGPRRGGRSAMKFHLNYLLIAGALTTLLAGCSSTTPLPVVPRVDLPRFMGDWYVIAAIPTRIERDAYDAVESYRLGEDGRIYTTFTFRQGGFDGPLRRYEPVGFVDPGSHGAVWGMRFVWPIRADYRVMYLDEDY